MDKGKLIVATPSILGDFNFRRSVILLASHKTTGSIGFILNKKLNYKLKHSLKDLVKDMLDSDIKLFKKKT